MKKLDETVSPGKFEKQQWQKLTDSDSSQPKALLLQKTTTKKKTLKMDFSFLSCFAQLKSRAFKERNSCIHIQERVGNNKQHRNGSNSMKHSSYLSPISCFIYSNLFIFCQRCKWKVFSKKRVGEREKRSWYGFERRDAFFALGTCQHF